MISKVFIVFVSVWPNFSKNLNRSIRKLQQINSKNHEKYGGDGGNDEDNSDSNRKVQRRTKI